MTPAEKNQVIQAARDFAAIHVDPSASELTRDLAYVALRDLMYANPDAFPDGKFEYRHDGLLVVEAPLVGFVLRNFFGEADAK